MCNASDMDRFFSTIVMRCKNSEKNNLFSVTSEISSLNSCSGNKIKWGREEYTNFCNRNKRGAITWCRLQLQKLQGFRRGASTILCPF
jgi:hypothetical protein